MKHPPCEVYRIERGGEITFHGPGQLVRTQLVSFIPIENESSIDILSHFEFAIPQKRLEMVFASFRTSRHRSIENIWIGSASSRGKNDAKEKNESIDRCLRGNKGLTGVWLDNKKIAAIGIAASKWITMHGVALNVINEYGIGLFIERITHFCLVSNRFERLYLVEFATEK